MRTHSQCTSEIETTSMARKEKARLRKYFCITMSTSYPDLGIFHGNEQRMINPVVSMYMYTDRLLLQLPPLLVVPVVVAELRERTGGPRAAAAAPAAACVRARACSDHYSLILHF